MSQLSILLLFALTASIFCAVVVKPYTNYNNVYGSLLEPNQNLGSVRFLGVLNSTNKCKAACLALGEYICYSFTYHTAEFQWPFTKHCYGVVNDPVWSLKQQDKVNSGRVLWPCRNDSDCSLNGQCLKSGMCQCRPQWTGPRCGELVLKPTDRLSGYHYQPNGVNISSWGGAVLQYGKNMTYHMFLAEIRNHCGINSWTLNSQVVHAMSDSPTGTFKRVEVVRQPFAHEPDAVKGPNGEFVLFWSENHYQRPLCNCSDGSTDPSCKEPIPMFYTLMSYSESPYGPWSKPVAILEQQRIPDTNFAAVILNDGKLIGFSRTWNLLSIPFTGSRLHLVQASNWKDPSTYMQHSNELFPNVAGGGIEDPFLYRDQNGYFHAIFHNMFPNNIQENCGGHAYSEDGLHWTFGGRSFGNKVEFTDGTSFTFTRRERPHFIFGEDGVTPVALTNGAQYGGKYGDATYTLLQPVGT